MKKILAILLAAMIMLSFVACSGNGGGQTANVTPEPTEAPTAEPTEEPVKSKEELMSSSTEILFDELAKLTYDNIAQAKMKYCDKDVIITGYILEINEDHVIMNSGSRSSSTIKIEAYIPLEDILNLERGQRLTVVGHLDEEIVDKASGDPLIPITYKHYVMTTAYFVNDIYEITGKLFGFNSSYGAFNFAVPPTNNYCDLIYFADGVNVSYGPFSKEIITVKGKMFSNGNVKYAVPVN